MRGTNFSREHGLNLFLGIYGPKLFMGEYANTNTLEDHIHGARIFQQPLRVVFAQPRRPNANKNCIIY
jgi:hypothetical protein